MVDALDFEGVEEALHRSVVETVAAAAHRGGYSRGGKDLAIRVGCVLHATIRVLDEPRGRALALDGHTERFNGDPGMQGLAHRPAHDLAGMHVDQRGEVEPALASGDVGQIREPDLVRGGRREVPPDPVRGDRVGVTAVGRPDPPGKRGQPAKACGPHEAGDAVRPNYATKAPQSGMHAGRPIDAAAVGMNVSDLRQKAAIVARPLALRPRAPSVVPAHGHSHHTAHHPHGPDITMLIRCPAGHCEAMSREGTNRKITGWPRRR